MLTPWWGFELVSDRRAPEPPGRLMRLEAAILGAIVAFGIGAMVLELFHKLVAWL